MILVRFVRGLVSIMRASKDAIVIVFFCLFFFFGFFFPDLFLARVS